MAIPVAIPMAPGFSPTSQLPAIPMVFHIAIPMAIPTAAGWLADLSLCYLSLGHLSLGHLSLRHVSLGVRLVAKDQ